MTVVEDRYQVTCSYCGLLETFMSRLPAFECATREHFKCSGHIEVFDLMAHKGLTDTWTWNGHAVHQRGGA